MPTHPHSLRRRAQGLTIIEILVTLVVISIGLLGVAALHASSMRNNYDALMRSHASALVGDISDRMRANSANIADYVVDFNDDRAVDEDSPLAHRDVADWKETLAAQLPEGDGRITFDAASSIVTIQIRWGERGVTMTFETQTEV